MGDFAMAKTTKKQGAGTSAEHYIQDAAEIYLAARLQEEAEYHGLSQVSKSNELNERWITYCDDRSVLDKFLKSKYRVNVDRVALAIVLDIAKKYPGQQFSFECVDAEFRAIGKKGDLLITFDSGVEVSVSVKNYQNGFDSIQVCSGTFNSTLNNFLFDNTNCAPGTYINPLTGEKFQGSNREVRDELVSKLYPQLLPFYHELDAINDSVRDFYINSEEAEYWDNVSVKWKEDCESIGKKVAQLINCALSWLPSTIVLARLQKATGLVSEEHLLCLGKGKYLFSLTNEKCSELTHRIANATHVYIYDKGQSVFYDIRDDKGVILTINQPCTLQKNGAWFATNEDRFDGVREKNDKGKRVLLKWGQRRPAKSKELATSTNTYLRLKSVVSN
ncbi:hypothetical protein SSZBM1_24 [Synechococcus phage S-SZBM1]|uniref:Uncharacterized protein n=1 Tax=Synechococcus phage S-SZBM1 TaxID=2926475 RepID=A0AC61TSD0_9CAUD|nr:hypothetical protein PP650_gp024 [Synechococcus phage S-SZBM1]UNH61141.1 hypothetical protein SSZBM1_24 [Synechococcus phage S-SZBM1]